MGERSGSDGPHPAVKYGLAIGFLALYAVALVGGFIATVTAVGWLDTNVLQPLVGGSGLVSAAALGFSVLAYVLVVLKIVSSGSVAGSNQSSALSSLTDSDWGRN